MDMGRSVDRLHPPEPCIPRKACVARHRIEARFVVGQLVWQVLFSARGETDDESCIDQPDKVECFPVPLPPHAEQLRIVAEVDRLLSIAREAEHEIARNLERALALRQGILQMAFSTSVE